MPSAVAGPSSLCVRAQNHVAKKHASLSSSKLTPHLTPSRVAAPCQPTSESRSTSRVQVPTTTTRLVRAHIATAAVALPPCMPPISVPACDPAIVVSVGWLVLASVVVHASVVSHDGPHADHDALRDWACCGPTALIMSVAAAASSPRAGKEERRTTAVPPAALLEDGVNDLGVVAEREAIMAIT